VTVDALGEPGCPGFGFTGAVAFGVLRHPKGDWVGHHAWKSCKLRYVEVGAASGQSGSPESLV